MTIEQQRQQYANIRNSLPHPYRGEWREIERAFADLDVPPTPSEWVAEVSKFSDEVSGYLQALGSWINLRSENPQGWGEDHDPNQINGWGDHQTIRTKTSLLRRQFNEDMQTMVSHDEWLESRAW